MLKLKQGNKLGNALLSNPRACASALCGALTVVVFALPAAASAETCPNEALRTGPSANLPDCRAYEQVTPPFKEGALPSLSGGFVISGLGGISHDGSRVDVVSAGDFGQPNSTNNNLGGASYELTRTGSGWSEENIDLPASQFPADLALGATPDLRETLFEARATGQPLNAMDLLIRAADGSLRDLGPFFPPSSTTEPPGLGNGSISNTGGAMPTSEDLSHVLFGITAPETGNTGEQSHLWPGDTTAPNSHGGRRFSFYEYVAGQGGPPALVGVDSEGRQIGQCGDAANQISADGSRVFFTVNPGACESGASGPPVKELFARTDEAQTVAISEPLEEDCSACYENKTLKSAGVLAEARFAAASTDGSKVFFTTSQPLLGADTSTNIYEYEFGTPTEPVQPGHNIVQVSAGAWGRGGAQVQDVSKENSTGVVKISPDGSHVYFVAKGALGGAVNSQGQHPTEGEDDLYVFERDAQFPGGRLSFIATLSPSDLEPLEAGCPGQGCGATVTPDGRFLAFTSSADLTPGDTSTARQVFEYDAQTGDLARVSIGQNGFNQSGNTDSFNAEIPHNNLAMSDDGAYVVFQSADGLTPQALNGRLEEFETEQEGVKLTESYYANNVYEYHDGNVYLISDGQDATTSGEARSSVQVGGGGITASGDDIFFMTADRLVPQDTDTQLDVYDARVGGGFPAPVSLLPACSGDACQGQLSASPVLLSPGSAFQAGGNPPLAAPAPAAKPKPKAKAKKCRKGFTRKHGKCVKNRAKKAEKPAKGRR